MKIGVFDSGAGGIAALNVLKNELPSCDYLFLADKKHAPYGTKTKAELKALVSADVRRLRALGAEEILVACCTASTVLQSLPEEDRRGVFPILAPTARAAAVRANGKSVAVLSTNATAQSGAFPDEIRKISKDIKIFPIPAQPLVSLVEHGARDGRMSECESAELRAILAPVKASGAGVLILGCTHYSHVRRTIASLLPEVCVVDAASEGAHAMAEELRAKYPENRLTGGKKLIYTI